MFDGPTLMIAMALTVTAPTGATRPSVTPLFRDHDTLALELAFPLGQLLDDGELEDRPFHPGTLTIAGTRIPVSVQLSGKSRLLTCDMPPLRLRLAPDAGAGTLFQGQQILFVTLQCHRRLRYRQHLVLEYLSYRVLNLLTDRSYQARLVQFAIRDTGSPASVAAWSGFLVEHPTLLGSRIGLEPLSLAGVEPEQIDPAHGALISLFQYFIGNTDWSMLAPAPGGVCCHNMQLLGRSGESIVPVPYDFDYAGLVDAPYALPNERLGLRSVRTRLYRGHCRFNPHLEAMALRFIDRRGDIERLFLDQPELSRPTMRRALRYVDYFYRTLEDRTRFQHQLSSRCR